MKKRFLLLLLMCLAVLGGCNEGKDLLGDDNQAANVPVKTP